MLRIILSFIFVLSVHLIYAQEIGSLCSNGIDDDGDGFVDCADTECARVSYCNLESQNCADGVDNNGDGKIDCDDSACASNSNCSSKETNCSDGIDNDGDGFIDYYDSDCGGTNPNEPAAYDRHSVIYEDCPGSGTAIFDLTDLDSAVGGGTGITVTWYKDAALSTSVGNPLNVFITEGAIFYAVLDNGNNQNTAKASFAVEARRDACFSYSSNVFCQNGINPLPTINISGGEFFGSSNLVINRATGEINLLASNRGNHTVTYKTYGNCFTTTSIDITIKDVLYSPNGIRASNPTPTSFNLSWDAVANADSYTIEISEHNPVDGQITEKIITTENTTVTITSLRESNQYVCAIGTNNDCGQSRFANRIYYYTIASSESRIKDSLALVALYHATNGDDWTRNDNWLTGPINTWYGVNMGNPIKRVSGIRLDSNNLNGGLPKEINHLSRLNSLSLIDNHINSLPDSFLYDNRISGWIHFNDLTFEDFLNKPFKCKYEEQNKIGTDTILYIEEGESYTIDLGIDQGLTDNKYLWFKNNTAIDITYVNSFTLTNLALDDSGIYTCKATNPGENYLTLYSYNYKLVVESKNRTVSSEDSLALVALYHATNGDHWKRNDHWLTGPVNTWPGVSVIAKRVYGLHLGNNNLNGTIPVDIGALTSLTEAFLGYNNLTGEIPKEIGKLQKLRNLALEYNQLTGNVPLEVISTLASNGSSYDSLGLNNNNLSGLPIFPASTETFAGGIDNNQFTFEDIAPNVSFFDRYFPYSPQAAIGKDTTVLLKEGSYYDIDLGIDETVTDNQYIWFRDSIAIDTVYVNSYTFSAITMSDEGVYTCEVTNPRAPELTLYSKPITIHVTPQYRNPEISAMKSDCVGKPIAFSAVSRHMADTYRWEIFASDTHQRIDLPDSLATAQAFSYHLQTAGEFIARLTLSSPYYVDTDTVLQSSFTMYAAPEVTLPESIAMDRKTTLTAINTQEVSGLTFVWTYQDSLSLPAQNTIIVDQEGIYQVVVTNPAGCQTIVKVFVMDVSKHPQSITFNSVKDKVYGEAPFALQATASSGLPVSFEITAGKDIISLQGNTVTILKAGQTTIRAMQVGNNEYDSAEPVQITFTIHKAPQTITFNAIADQTIEAASITLQATSSEAPPINFTTTGPAALSGNTLTLLDTGLVTVTAAQAGNDYYLPAVAVSQSFRVVATEKPVEPDSTEQLYAIAVQLTTANQSPMPTVMATVFRKEGNRFVVVAEKAVSNISSLQFDSLPSGNYTVRIKPDDGNFLTTYAGNGLTLAQAQTIALSQDMVQSVILIPKPDASVEGNIAVSGILLSDPAAGNGRISTNKSNTEGTPLQSIAVYLLDAGSKKVAAYDVTDQEGKFDFAKLTEGRYLFVADYEGLPQEEAQNAVSIASNQAGVFLTAVASDRIWIAAINVVNQVTGTEKEVYQNPVLYYPNPVIHELWIEVDPVWLNGTLRVSDLSGKLLKTEKVRHSKMKVNMETFQTGVYHITISKNNVYRSFKVSKQ